MYDLQEVALKRSEAEMSALLKDVQERLKKNDTEALAELADFRLMLNNSLAVKNLDTGNHLLGVTVDWNGNKVQVRIPPGHEQRIDNFSFLTMWFIRLHVDPPVRLTNKVDNIAFYNVNKLLGNGQSQQMQFVNPHLGASEVYPLWPGERLIVVPNNMANFILEHDLDMKFLHPPEMPESRKE